MIGTRFSAVTLALAAAVSVSAAARAADATERKFIREGMSEGEVLLKIGSVPPVSELELPCV